MLSSRRQDITLSVIAISVSGVLLAAWIGLFVYAQSTSSTVERLSKRVSELEVQNVYLSEQLEWKSDMEKMRSIELASMEYTRQNASTEVLDTDVKVEDTGSSDERTTDLQEIQEIKDDLRQEVQTIVEQEQDAAREKRREEYEERMRVSVEHSLIDFADDNNLDDRVRDRLETVMKDAMDRRLELRDALETENISYYDFRLEQQKQRDLLDDKLSGILTAEQMEAFDDAFPGRWRRQQ